MKYVFYSLIFVFSFGCKKDKELAGVSGTYINSADSNFVLKASMNNYTAIQLSHIAVNISTDSLILSYANQIVDEHTLYRQKLNGLADSLNVIVADSLDSAHILLRTYLLTLSGRQFDSVYIHNELIDNEATLQLHQNEISSGNNSRIKSFAFSYLSEIERQKNLSDSISSNY